MTDIDRFTDKIQTAPNGCWLWLAGTDKQGYGRFYSMGAHRWAYEYLFGPPRHHLHHECFNKLCANPTHLIDITRSDHAQLHGALIRDAVTHCPQGHSYADNFIMRKKGSRECRICCSDRARERSRNGKNKEYHRNWLLAHPDYLHDYYQKRKLTHPYIPVENPQRGRKPDPSIPFRTEKPCGRCHEALPIAAFGVRTASPDGRASTCPPCKALYKQEHKRSTP